MKPLINSKKGEQEAMWKRKYEAFWEECNQIAEEKKQFAERILAIDQLSTTRSPEIASLEKLSAENFPAALSELQKRNMKVFFLNNYFT